MVLYIGQTADIGRVFRNSLWRAQVKSVKILVFTSRWDAINAEREAILKHQPRYNIQKVEKLSDLQLRRRKIRDGELPAVYTKISDKTAALAHLPKITLKTPFNK